MNIGMPNNLQSDINTELAADETTATMLNTKVEGSGGSGENFSNYLKTEMANEGTSEGEEIDVDINSIATEEILHLEDEAETKVALEIDTAPVPDIEAIEQPVLPAQFPIVNVAPDEVAKAGEQLAKNQAPTLQATTFLAENVKKQIESKQLSPENTLTLKTDEQGLQDSKQQQLQLAIQKVLLNNKGDKQQLTQDEQQALLAAAQKSKAEEIIPNELKINYTNIDAKQPTTLATMQNGFSQFLQPSNFNVKYSTNITTPVSSAEWGSALSEKVVWLSNQSIKAASIQVHPPELGPLEVKIKLNHEQATVLFTSQHGAVREAIESALPRLRDMFQENGLNLADVDVSEQSLQQSQEDNNNPQQAEIDFDGNNTTSENTEVVESKINSQNSSGLFDYYV